MSKFIKRIKKSGLKKLKNIIVLGTAMGNLTNFLDECDNVFVLRETYDDLRRKNLIYRDNFDSITIFPEIDLVVVDKNFMSSLDKLKQILVRYSPLIIIEGEEYLAKQEYNTISTIGYRAVDLSRGVQVWKMNP